MAEPCGCRAPIHNPTNYIDYCSTHAAAPVLLAALKKIANYGNAVAGEQHTNVSWGRQQMAEEARAAIAKAKGEEE